MASIPMVLQRVRRARREAREPPTVGQFRRYEPAYREILEAAENAAGEDVLEEISDWLLDWTERQKRLPEPETLREHARDVLVERGIQIPDRLQSAASDSSHD